MTIGVPYLTLIQAKTRIDQAQARVKSEIDLLNPFNRAVELVGREKDLESLWQWLHTDRPIDDAACENYARIRSTGTATEITRKCKPIRLDPAPREAHPRPWLAASDALVMAAANWANWSFAVVRSF